MATRSRIAIQKEDGTVEAIYCHWDGYPNGVGVTLLENYSYEDACKLIELGDISALGSTIEETIAYSRDRGESYEDVKARTFSSKDEFFKSDFDEWGYLIIPITSQWFVKGQYHTEDNFLDKYLDKYSK